MAPLPVPGLCVTSPVLDVPEAGARSRDVRTRAHTPRAALLRRRARRRRRVQYLLLVPLPLPPAAAPALVASSSPRLLQEAKRHRAHAAPPNGELSALDTGCIPGKAHAETLHMRRRRTGPSQTSALCSRRGRARATCTAHRRSAPTSRRGRTSSLSTTSERRSAPSCSAATRGRAGPSTLACRPATLALTCFRSALTSLPSSGKPTCSRR